MKTFLILPHQLFAEEYLPEEEYEYVLWEHPQYFTKYNYNKKRLVMHRASMKYYQDYLKKNKHKVTYYEYNKKPKLTEYDMFDPIDKLGLKGDIYESPNFLLTEDDYNRYREKTDKFFFHNFYNWSKKELDIIPKIKSQDKLNRNKLPSKKMDIPDLPPNGDKKYIDEAVRYVNKNFSKNYGTAENFQFPVSHSVSRKWLKDFVKDKFKLYGDYQDAITDRHDYLYHSCLSTCINIGLLNPSEIIEYIDEKKAGIPMNSYEGYIRQLFWREYQRYCYIHYNFNGKNYFGNNKKMGKGYYDGTTGIVPVDDCIKKAFENGYLHHIERLMVVGNYMNLDGIKPMDGMRWFIEFSCDSYEWVMHQNVLDMVFCVTGGDTMRKPYISSSNYILKMSDYEEGEWSKEWNKKFRNFTDKNKDKLYKFRYFFPFLFRKS